MIPKIAVVAALVLFGFLAVAEAESVRGGEASTPSSGASATVQPLVVSGWNYFHIANCGVFNDFLYFFPLEAIGINFFVTNDLVAIAALTPACQSGNLVAVFITNTSPVL